MFEIGLTDQTVEELDPGVDAVYGQIRIGDFQETFIASLDCWKPDQYEQHWISAVRRIVHSEERSALITSYVEPSLSQYLVWWPLYRVGENVHFQNQLLFFNQLGRPFSAEKFWDSVGERRQCSDDGRKISEWILPVKDVKAYLRRKENQG